MAVAYSAIANGGNIVRPHLAQLIEDPAGRVVQEFDPGAARLGDHRGARPARRSSTASTRRRWSRAGRRTRFSAASRSTSPARPERPSAASTRRTSRGTSRSRHIPDPKVVVAVTIEEGGFGADAAAPAASQILGAYFDKPNASAAPPRGGGASARSTTDGDRTRTRTTGPAPALAAAQLRGSARRAPRSGPGSPTSTRC